MMIWRWLVVALAACGFPQPGDVARVRGTVHGLWNGGDGVALQLTAEGEDTLVTAVVDGEVEFPRDVAPGTSYVASVYANPARHTCSIVTGANGVVADDAPQIDVACVGPPISIRTTAPITWTFDESLDEQTIALSLIEARIGLVVDNGAGTTLASADVDGAAITLGARSPTIALPFGQTQTSVHVVDESGLDKTFTLVLDRGGRQLEQAVYAKATPALAGAQLGFVEFTFDGDTMAVGGSYDSGAAAGAGAVFVFRWNGTAWLQEARLEASNPDADDNFGFSVALIGDTLAIGAPNEASAATGVNSNGQADNSAPRSGAAYVFHRTGTVWTQEAYVKASNTNDDDLFGVAVALSTDGTLLAVGAQNEASSSGGINGVQTDNSATRAGAAYVYQRDSQGWSQVFYLKAPSPHAGEQFGVSLRMTGTPLDWRLAVGAPGTNQSTGAVHVFRYSDPGSAGGTPFIREEATLTASNAELGDTFGSTIALSGDTLAVGAWGEDGGGAGVNPDPADNSKPDSGAAYVFQRTGSTWTQQAYIKATNPVSSGQFGTAVAIVGDLFVVSSPFDVVNVAGVHDTPPSGPPDPSIGAAYVYSRTGTTWTPRAFIKPSNPDTGDEFGWAVALSPDALGICAIGESSAASGIDPPGGQADNSAPNTGALYIFR